MTSAIRIKPRVEQLPFGGGSIVIVNRQAVVTLVAHLLAGQHLHVQRILSGTPATSPGTTTTILDGAIAKLAPPATEGNRALRDGWVFQMLTWLAARATSSQRTLCVPQMHPGRQGFDCLYLEMDTGGSGGRPILTICEDKATVHPRNTIKSEVFPEFIAFEAGERDAELQAELSALLQRHPGIADPDAVMSDLQWKEIRRYSIAVTADDLTAGKPAKLFKDFDDVIPGDRERRAAVVHIVDDLRAWMDAFCGDLTAELQRMAAPKVKPKLKPKVKA